MKELESILKELHLCLSLGSLWWKTSSLCHILHKHDFQPFAIHIHSEIILLEFVVCFDSSSVSSILKQKIYSTFARSVPVVRVKNLPSLNQSLITTLWNQNWKSCHSMLSLHWEIWKQDKSVSQCVRRTKSTISGSTEHSANLFHTSYMKWWIYV